MSDKLRIGYIPLVDATALLVAVDEGFAAAEGLSIDLIREVSWSNVRDKLNIGLFDAAHLLSPVAIASSLGIGHVRVPLLVPFNLGINGNAITVSPRLFAMLSNAADGDLTDPKVSARALARVVAERKTRGREALTFGMTFPFSNHNYQLRYWMAAGGLDPDDDVRLVVLPPPYMVDSLASGHVDGFCVGAPWNSVAVDLGIGNILHFGCEIMARASEKVLAFRERWAEDNRDALLALIRALARASAFASKADNHLSVAHIVAQRLGIHPELVVRTLTGNLKTGSDGTIRKSDRYIVVAGHGALAEELRARSERVFRADLYDAALGRAPEPGNDQHGGNIGAFVGPEFDHANIAGYVSAWRSKPAQRPRLSIVR